MRGPLQSIRHLLVDLDGVLYLGNTVLPSAAEFVSWLHRRSIRFRLVTNNSTLTPEQYVEKLAGMGIQVATDEIFTSALATCLYLEEHGFDGQSAYVIGETGLMQAVAGANLHLDDSRPDWVIVGLDRQVTYQKLSTAALALAAGARYLATNSDTSLPTEQGLAPGAGAILAALTATTGKQPIVVGKPQPLMLELAMKQLGGALHDTAMLGDRLNTDIQAAAAARMRSILVLTGVSTREEAEHSDVRPTLIVDDLADLMRRWSAGTS